MPFTVLKKSKLIEDQIEVAGEFPEEADARSFVAEMRLHESSDDHDYTVEIPPSKTD